MLWNDGYEDYDIIIKRENKEKEEGGEKEMGRDKERGRSRLLKSK